MCRSLLLCAGPSMKFNVVRAHSWVRGRALLDGIESEVLNLVFRESVAKHRACDLRFSTVIRITGGEMFFGSGEW